MSESKFRPFKHTQSVYKWPAGYVYIGYIISYLIYLSDPFPKGLERGPDRSSTFSTLIILMHINRLGLFKYFYDVYLIVLPYFRVAKLALQPFLWKWGGGTL